MNAQRDCHDPENYDFRPDNPYYPYFTEQDYVYKNVTRFIFNPQSEASTQCEWHRGKIFIDPSTQKKKELYIVVLDGKEADQKTEIIDKIRKLEERAGIPVTAHILLISPSTPERRIEEYCFMGKKYANTKHFIDYFIKLVQRCASRDHQGKFVSSDITTVGFSLTAMTALQIGSIAPHFEKRKVVMIAPSAWEIDLSILYTQLCDKFYPRNFKSAFALNMQASIKEFSFDTIQSVTPLYKKKFGSGLLQKDFYGLLDDFKQRSVLCRSAYHSFIRDIIHTTREQVLVSGGFQEVEEIIDDYLDLFELISPDGIHGSSCCLSESAILSLIDKREKKDNLPINTVNKNDIFLLGIGQNGGDHEWYEWKHVLDCIMHNKKEIRNVFLPFET